jgi:hypothetical protein
LRKADLSGNALYLATMLQTVLFCLFVSAAGLVDADATCTADTCSSGDAIKEAVAGTSQMQVSMLQSEEGAWPDPVQVPAANAEQYWLTPTDSRNTNNCNPCIQFNHKPLDEAECRQAANRMAGYRFASAGNVGGLNGCWVAFNQASLKIYFNTNNHNNPRNDKRAICKVETYEPGEAPACAGMALPATAAPTAAPTAEPTPEPTPEPTAEPTPEPTDAPTPAQQVRASSDSNDGSNDEDCEDGECTVWGDPHINVFDKAQVSLEQVSTNMQRPLTKEDGRTAVEIGDVWLVKHPQLHIQGRYNLVKRRENKPFLRAVAIGGPLMQGNKLVVGPLHGRVLWNEEEILKDGEAQEFNINDLLNASSAKDTVMVQDDSKTMPGLNLDLPMGVKMVVNRHPDILGIRISVLGSLKGVDGQCGNFNGDASDDTEDAIRARVGEGIKPLDILFPAEFNPWQEDV